jgi:hypothetical protein
MIGKGPFIGKIQLCKISEEGTEKLHEKLPDLRW